MDETHDGTIIKETTKSFLVQPDSFRYTGDLFIPKSQTTFIDPDTGVVPSWFMKKFRNMDAQLEIRPPKRGGWAAVEKIGVWPDKDTEHNGDGPEIKDADPDVPAEGKEPLTDKTGLPDDQKEEEDSELSEDFGDFDAEFGHDIAGIQDQTTAPQDDDAESKLNKEIAEEFGDEPDTFNDEREPTATINITPSDDEIKEIIEEEEEEVEDKDKVDNDKEIEEDVKVEVEDKDKAKPTAKPLFGERSEQEMAKILKEQGRSKTGDNAEKNHEDEQGKSNIPPDIMEMIETIDAINTEVMRRSKKAIEDIFDTEQIPETAIMKTAQDIAAITTIRMANRMI